MDSLRGYDDMYHQAAIKHRENLRQKGVRLFTSSYILNKKRRFYKLRGKEIEFFREEV